MSLLNLLLTLKEIKIIFFSLSLSLALVLYFVYSLEDSDKTVSKNVLKDLLFLRLFIFFVFSFFFFVNAYNIVSLV